MKSIKDMKISLAGASGTGKNALMQAWSKKYDMPSVAVEIHQHAPTGIASHLDIIRMSSCAPHDGVKFQSELLEARAEAFKSTEGGFISDQSVVDSYAYYAIHNSMFASPQLDMELARVTEQSLRDIDLTVVLIPDLSKSGIPDNGIRLVSLPYYRAVSSIILQTMQDLMYRHDDIIATSLHVNSHLGVHVAVSDTTSFCMIDEGSYENGQAPIEDRIAAIEKALAFIALSKAENNVQSAGASAT
ncbi:hypothetical protein [Ralstonia phage RP13]|nr:hypothetical protein [Ralstonia phage RP13]